MKSQLWVQCVLVLLVASMGCSSAQKRGENYLEKEMYAEAISEFEVAVQKDPQSVDAKEGLKKAREGWISKELIGVRNERLAGDMLGAAEKLLAVVVNERKWDIPSAHKAQFTQGEETESFLGFYEFRLREDLKLHRPLRAQTFINRFAPVVTGSKPGVMDYFLKKTKAEGTNQCEEFKRWAAEGARRPKVREGVPYFRRWVGSLCKFWGQLDVTSPELTGLKSVPYYKGVRLEASVRGWGPSQTEIFHDRLESALKETGWFLDDAPKKLPMTATGIYLSRDDVVEVTQNHVYYEQVPYTEYVTVTKTRQVPYQATRMVTDLSVPGHLRQESYTDYRYENYTEQEPHTAYRNEQRYYAYQAQKHDQHLEWDVGASSDLGYGEQKIGYRQSAARTGIEHQQEVPNIGLHPSSANLINDGEWFRSQVDAEIAQVKARWVQTWVEKFCQAEPGSSDAKQSLALAVVSDRAELCLRQHGVEVPVWIQNWYHDQLGVTVAESQALLGRE